MSVTANGHAPTIGERARDAAVNAGQQVMSGLEWWLLRSSEIPTTPFLAGESFPWAGSLSGHWREIRGELEQVLDRREELPNFQDILRDVAPISQDDRWKTFFFSAYGYRADANRVRCPATSAALDEIPGLITAFFSILAPGKRIPPHRGPYRGVVRCPLGLLVPDPPTSCGIRVGGEVRHWQEGQALFFDDGYEHSAWNDSDGTRAVLFLDIVRPLRRPAADVNRALLWAIGASPFLRDARRRHQVWENRFERLAR